MDSRIEFFLSKAHLGVARFVLLIAAMAIGFTEFPTHAWFVGSTLIFVQVSTSFIVSSIQIESRRQAQERQLEGMAVQIALNEIARTIKAGEAFDDECADQIWLGAHSRARSRMAHSQTDRPGSDARGYSAGAMLVAGLTLNAAIYVVVIATAAFISRFL